MSASGTVSKRTLIASRTRLIERAFTSIHGLLRITPTWATERVSGTRSNAFHGAIDDGPHYPFKSSSQASMTHRKDSYTKNDCNCIGTAQMPYSQGCWWKWESMGSVSDVTTIPIWWEVTFRKSQKDWHRRIKTLIRTLLNATRKKLEIDEKYKQFRESIIWMIEEFKTTRNGHLEWFSAGKHRIQLEPFKNVLFARSHTVRVASRGALKTRKQQTAHKKR